MKLKDLSLCIRLVKIPNPKRNQPTENRDPATRKANFVPSLNKAVSNIRQWQCHFSGTTPSVDPLSIHAYVDIVAHVKERYCSAIISELF